MAAVDGEITWRRESCVRFKIAGQTRLLFARRQVIAVHWLSGTEIIHEVTHANS